MALSANEQWLLELINRGRLDPLGEAARYDIPLNEGLDSGTIDATPKQPLAPNAELADAAEAHSAWMLETDVFSHAGVGGSSPKDRMVSAGYDFGGAYSWGENLSWRGSTAGIDLEAAIPAHHAGLYASAGHRENLMQESFREVGIAQLEGNFTHAGTTYRSSMITEDFAHTRGRLFVTGVAYADRDGDAFYDPGEGRRGVAFRAGDAQAESARAGGYALPVSGPAATVAIDGGGVSGEVRVDTSAGNVKLDLVDGALATSADLTLRAGPTEAVALGAGDVRLTGRGSGDRLTGNGGDNRLAGRGGDDRLAGRGGDDTLEGGNGDDVLDGGNGDDVLRGRGDDDRLDGGRGDDRLKGGEGDDILDGGGGTDTVKLNTARADTTVLARGDEFVFLSGDGLDRATNIERIAFSDTTRDAAATHRPGIANFGTEDGWHAQDAYPRRLGDIDGDGKDDIVGFGAAATFSARADGDGTFSGFGEALANFGQAQAWNGFEDNPRLLGDIDGDGADDIVGFGDGITLSALAKGDGTFRPAEKAIANFSQGQFWDSFEANPRALGDINGDGAEDLLGFGDSLTLAALSNGDGTFQPAEKVLTNFSQGQYWNSYGANPRLLGDINRDGRDDIVGFGDDRTFAALARSDGTFGAVRPAIADFSQAQAWSSFDATPRLMADLDGDKADDIVGFGNADIVVALAEGDGTFGPVRKAGADLSRAHGWTSQDALPRLAGDVDEDGADELVGFSPFGPLVADYTGDGFEFLG